MPGLLDSLDPRQLQPQQTPSGYAGAGPETASLPAPPYPQPGKMQRLAQMLAAVRDGMMPVPEGLRGLLSDGDIASARRSGLLNMGAAMLRASSNPNGPAMSTGAALGQGIQEGQQAFQGGLGSAVQAGQTGIQMAQMRRIMAGRDQIAKDFPPQPGESQSDLVHRLTGMYVAATRNNDTEMMKASSDVLGKLGEDPNLIMAKLGKPLQEISTGDTKILRDVRTGQIVATLPMNATPMELRNYNRELANNRFQQSQDLSKQFDSQSKEFETAARAHASIQAIAPAALRGDPAAQKALLMQFAQLTKPGSPISPRDYPIYSKMGGLSDRFEVILDRLGHGKSLSTPQVQTLIQNAESLNAAHHARFNGLMSQYTSKARDFGADPSHVVYDVYKNAQPDALPPAAAPRGSGANDVRRLLHP